MKAGIHWHPELPQCLAYSVVPSLADSSILCCVFIVIVVNLMNKTNLMKISQAGFNPCQMCSISLYSLYTTDLLQVILATKVSIH